MKAAAYITRLAAIALQLLLVGVVLLSAALAPSEPWFLRGLVWLAFLLSFIVGTARPRRVPFFLGIVLCTLPFFRQGAVLGSSAALLFGAIWARRGSGATPRDGLFGFLLIVLAAVVPAMRSAALHTDALLWRTLLQEGLLLDYLRGAPPPMVLGVLNAASMLVGFVAALFFAGDKDAGEGFLRGCAWGALLASLVLVMQLAGLHPVFDLNRGPFFIHAKQYAAAFSDPNAFGVFAAVICPLLMLRSRTTPGRVSGAVLAVGALWSGSRTYLLGLVLWAIFLTLSRLCSTASCTRRRLVVAAAAAGAAVIISVIPAVNSGLQAHSPPSVARLLKTVNVDQSAEMLHSRTLYLRLALQVWRRAPLGGVGGSRFYELQEEAARELGVELGGWRDNANSFYFQTLAEGGAAALLCTAVGLWLLLYASRRAGIAFSALGVFVLLLVTGPHTNFEEIAILFGALAGMALCAAESRMPARGRIGAPVGAFALLLLFVVNSAAYFNAEVPSRGLYPAESSQSGAVSWTAREARINLCPETRVVAVRAANPDLAAQSVEVNIESDGRREMVVLADSSWREVPVAGDTAKLEVSRVWSPLNLRLSKDPRALGVMVRLSELTCAAKR